MRLVLVGLLLAGCAAHPATGSDGGAVGTGGDAGTMISVALPSALGGGSAMTRFSPSTPPTITHGSGIPLPIPTPPTSHRVQHDALPASVDISSGAPPVGDQGPTGSCQTWSTSYTALGWWASHVGLANAQFAPMYLYAQLVHGNCSIGGYVEQMLEMLQQQGVDTSSDYEPMEQVLDCGTQPNAQQHANAANFEISGYTQLDLSGGAREAIESAVAAGKPAILSIVEYPEFVNATQSNYLVGPPVAGDVALFGHAITAFAYDDNGVWIENSWGTSWGDYGWAELSWDFVDGSFGSAANVGDVATIDGVALSCSDSNASCAAWAQSSQCQENPDYMLTSCCASCANPSLAYQAYELETLVDPSSCLDIIQGGTANRTKLDEYTCNGTGAQQFTVLNAGNGVVHLYNPQSGKCVDDPAGNTTDGTQMQIYGCNGTAAQDYVTTWYTDGSVLFQKANTSTCIDVDHQQTANGTKVQMWDCNATVAQRWFSVAE